MTQVKSKITSNKGKDYETYSIYSDITNDFFCFETFV